MTATSLAILRFADYDFEYAASGNPLFEEAVIGLAIGAIGLVGCALVCQVRWGRRARREERRVLLRFAAVNSAILTPWLIFVAIEDVEVAAVLLALGLVEALAITAVCTVVGRRAER